MGSLSNDIIKYRKGELNPEQTHALEKKALTDPFLAEALEGVENISGQELDWAISAIEKNILTKKKINRFAPLRIAAGIILVVAVVFIIYQFIPRAETIALKTEKQRPENKKEEVAKPITGSGKEGERADGKMAKGEGAEEKKKKSELIVSSTQNPTASPKRHQDQQPGSSKQNSGAEIQVEPIQQAPVENLASAEEQRSKTENADVQTTKQAVTPTGKTAGANAISSDQKKDSFAASEAGRSAAPSAKFKSIQSISGQVVSAEDGLPLPGVNIIIKGTATSTVTDLKGHYSLPIETENRSLVFSFSGFEQQEKEASSGNKIDVQMKDDVAQLSELIVTGVRLTKNENPEPVIRLAEPVAGKRAFDNYLEQNLKYPEEALKNKKRGKVTVEFKVGVDGGFSDFRVIKKLGYGCEQEVIRLVKTGPPWTPSTQDNKPIESTIRIGFQFDPLKKGR